MDNKAPVHIDVRHGAIENVVIDYRLADDRGDQRRWENTFVGKKLHEIRGPADWQRLLTEKWPEEGLMLRGSLHENSRAWNDFGKLEKAEDFLGRIFDH
jgi:hypothetical protein